MLAFGSSEAFVQRTLLVPGCSGHPTAVPLHGPRPKQNEVRPRLVSQRWFVGCTTYRRRKTDTRLSGLLPVRPGTAHLPSVLTAGASREGGRWKQPGQQRQARRPQRQPPRARASATAQVPPPLSLPRGPPRPEAQARPIPPAPSVPSWRRGWDGGGRAAGR